MIGKNNIYTLVLSLIPGVVLAQTGTNGWVIENIHGPSQVGIVDTIPIDLNKDGLMDVVSASTIDGHLRVYINQGDLVFDQQYISEEVFGAYRVSATDFNNDGQIDFIVPSIETNEVIALIADDTAQPHGWRKQIVAKDVLLPTDAQAGDFNNDGLIDVVSTSFEENLLLLHLQDQQGEFTTTVLSDTPQGPRKLVVEDFNNDQLTDILLASSADNSVRLFSNVGGASFNEMLISDQLPGIRYIAKCDFSDNNYPGFVAGVTNANQVTLFANNSNNTFSAKVIDDDLPEADSVHCADIDQDQEAEIISISRLFGNIYTQEIYGPQNKQLIANSRDGYITATATTLEASASPVILTQAFFDNRNLIYQPNVVNQEQVVWEDFPDGASKVVQADINNDGIQDIVVTSFKDNRVQWYDGINYQHHVIAENINGAADLVVGDFNQDGLMDVVTAASFDNRFYLHLNSQSENFVTSTLFEEALFANALAITDLDQDGWLDVIGSSGSDDRLRWFKFTEEKYTTIDLGVTGDAPNDVEVGDIDADGDMDLLVVNFFSGDVVIYQNDGKENFISEIISSGWSRPYASVLRHKPQTELIDINVTMSANNQVIELIQPMSLQFEENLLFDGSENPRKLAFDADNEVLYVTSPDDKNIVSIGGQIVPQAVVENYLGVSDINLTTQAGQLISSSRDLNSISLLTQDLIFKSNFSDQFK